MNFGGFLTIVVTIVAAGMGLTACQAPVGPTGAATPGSTGSVQFNASLTGAQGVPPVDTPGLGSGVMTYEPATRTLRWSVTYDRLSSPATAAHFHGPADRASNAGVAVPIAGPGMTGPISGNAVLTDAQAAELLAGLWYVNVHTATYPGGEIRGQVLRAP